jgi:hypothetical protein
VDLDVIDEFLIRYSAFFHRMLTVLECRSKSSIYTLQESLGERKTLRLFIILLSSSLYTSETVRCIHPKQFAVYIQNSSLYTPKTVRCIHPKQFAVYVQNSSLYTSKTVRCVHPKQFAVYIQNSSLYTSKTVLLVAYLRTWNQDVTETVAKADRQGIQSYM